MLLYSGLSGSPCDREEVVTDKGTPLMELEAPRHGVIVLMCLISVRMAWISGQVVSL